MRRVGIVGLGMAVAPHARSLLDLADRVEVAFAFSPSEARRRAFAAQYPFPLADDLDAALADESVDAVLILTPPNTDLELVRKAVAAGKHVLLEKPLEVTVERAAALVEICRANERTLGIVLQHRFRPAAQRLKQIVEGEELGVLFGASAGIRLWRPQSYYDAPGRGTKARDGGGVLITQAIHTLDLLLHLAGDAAEVAAFAATTPVHSMETEDHVVAALRFAGGAIGTIEATTAAWPGFPERIELLGTMGTAILAGTEISVLHSDGRAETAAADGAPGGTGADPMAFPHDYHRSLIADFLDALDAGRAPSVGGADGLRVQRLIDAILESAVRRPAAPRI